MRYEAPGARRAKGADGDHVASGWIDVRTSGDVTVRVYDDSNVVQVSAGIGTDEVTGEKRLVVCVSLALGPFVNPVEECRDRPLPLP